MSILDYAFSVEVRTPIPQANTEFLRRVAVVAKPLSNYAGAGIELITNKNQIANFTANTEIVELFNGGLQQCFLVLGEDLQDCESIIEANQDKFYSLAISSDFGNTPFLPTRGSIKLTDVEFYSKASGVDTNEIELEIIDDNAEGVTVTDKKIQVHIDISGQSRTVADLKAQIENDLDANNLISVVDIDGVKLAPTLALTSFTHGHDDFSSSFAGVIYSQSNNSAELETNAVKSNHVAFYGSDTHKAKNMMFIIGKFLSANEWSNEQYVEAPYDDGVILESVASNFQEKGISFIYSDAQIGLRLGFFAVGKRAIIAPYVIKQLTIDLQSRALTWINLNRPQYTQVWASRLQSNLDDQVIKKYIAKNLIPFGDVEILTDGSNFVGSGTINIGEPTALWRLKMVLISNLEG